jgi:transcriptional regulator with XRE-family HTH domain
VPRPTEDSWRALGEFIHAQRRLANLSLRQMAEMAQVSNPYLSQIERGLYRPSPEILKGIARALQISAESLYAQAGLLDERREDSPPEVERAIRLDPELTTEQKETLIRVYRGFLDGVRQAPA